MLYFHSQLVVVIIVSDTAELAVDCLNLSNNMLPNDANIMSRGITAVIDLCKCPSIGKSSCALLLPALPALLSATSILDHGPGGVRRETSTCDCFLKAAHI